MYISPEEFLEHYGVKGMKWGVRKARVETRSGTMRSRGYKTNRVAKAAGYGFAATFPIGGWGVLAGAVANNRAKKEMMRAVYNRTLTTKKDYSRSDRRKLIKSINNFTDVKVKSPKTGEFVKIRDMDLDAARIQLRAERKGVDG